LRCDETSADATEMAIPSSKDEQICLNDRMWVFDVSLDVVKLFSNHYLSYVFSLILKKLGTRDLCANMQEHWNRFVKF